MAMYGMTRDENVELIVKTALEYGITDKRQIAYMLATTQHETGNFRDTDEQGSQARADHGDYIGRGYAQLTHRGNYQKFDDLLGLNGKLVNDPDLASRDAKLSAQVLVIGSEYGLFTGVGLPKYINSQDTDYFNARRVINGTDVADKIAGYAKDWEQKLQGVIDKVSQGGIEHKLMPGSPLRDGSLSLDEQGPEVSRLQDALNKNGANLKPDGDFGQGTEAAVKEYQSRHKITPTGIAGPETLKSLGIDVNQQTQSSTPQPPTPQPPTPQPPTPQPPSAPAGAQTEGQVTLPTGFGTWPTPGHYEKNVGTKGDPTFGSDRSNSLGYHAGFDILGKIGDPVLSYKSGTVDAVGTDPPDVNGGGAGHWIQIKHNDGTFTMYQHLIEEPKFKEGTPIKEGQQIGQIGDSGNAKNFPQLHFELRGGDGGGSRTAINPSAAFQLEGMKGPQVKELQTLLQASGYDVGKVDGNFDGRTKGAVTKWQQDHGLKPTGVVDGNTFEAITHPEKYRAQPTPQPTPQAIDKSASPTAPQPTPPQPTPQATDKSAILTPIGLGKLDDSLVTSDKFPNKPAHELYKQVYELTKTLPEGTFEGMSQQQRAAAGTTLDLALSGKTNPQSMMLDTKGIGLLYVFESKDPKNDASLLANTPKPVDLNAVKDMPLQVSSGLLADLGQKQVLQPPTGQQQDAVKSQQTNPANPVQINQETMAVEQKQGRGMMV
jgi:peptidoglycan hydrolase-like protein with peptidoglycan-binding domain/predicted chitinase